jgi:hypothetical protein
MEWRSSGVSELHLFPNLADDNGSCRRDRLFSKDFALQLKSIIAFDQSRLRRVSRARHRRDCRAFRSVALNSSRELI